MANLLASGAYWRCDGDCQERAEHARKQTVWQGRHRGCALSEEDSHPLKTLISTSPMINIIVNNYYPMINNVCVWAVKAELPDADAEWGYDDYGQVEQLFATSGEHFF